MKDLIDQIEKRFELVLTISIFFPVLMMTYFQVTHGSESQQNSTFIYFTLAGCYILAYAIFQLHKILPPIPMLALQMLDWGLWLSIACFAIPILFFAGVSQGDITFPSWWSYWISLLSFQGSMWGIVGLGFVILYFVTAILLIAILQATILRKLSDKKIF